MKGWLNHVMYPKSVLILFISRLLLHMSWKGCRKGKWLWDLINNVYQSFMFFSMMLFVRLGWGHVSNCSAVSQHSHKRWQNKNSWRSASRRAHADFKHKRRIQGKIQKGGGLCLFSVSFPGSRSCEAPVEQWNKTWLLGAKVNYSIVFVRQEQCGMSQ